MQLRKDILLFYVLILASAGVIIAADQPVKKVIPTKNGVKCSILPKPTSSPMPLNILKQGILHFKA